MICPDLNLLLYASFRTFPLHQKAKAWWDHTLSTALPVSLGHVVIMGFIRVSTHARVFSPPLSLPQAIQVVDGWLAQPNVTLIAPAEGHWKNFKAMLSSGTVGGNLTTDAHIAALAADYGLVVHSNDTDFARFPNVKWVNPL